MSTTFSATRVVDIAITAETKRSEYTALRVTYDLVLLADVAHL